MKAAVVLFADTASLFKQAAEINRLLSDMAAALEGAELWLFYCNRKPAGFPDISCFLSCVRLIRIEHPHLPESFLTLLEQIIRENSLDLLVFASDGRGGELATRMAYRLNGSSCVQVESAKFKHQKLEVTKTAYNHHIIASFTLDRTPYCLSAAQTPCQPASIMETKLPVFELTDMNQLKPDWIKSFSMTYDTADAQLDSAKIVLATGCGVKNRDNLERLKRVAETLGAVIGVSRPAVMNAWAKTDRLIGVSGKILSPSLCIAAGVSGSGAFSMGIKNSEFIVAVNTDPHAAIFHIADVGIVDDLMTILTELEDVVNVQRSAEPKV